MTVMTKPSTFSETWDAFQRDHDAPDFVNALRASSWSRFEELGFPTLKHEDWRLTDVSALADTEFSYGRGGSLPAEFRIGEYLYEGLAGPRLVFVNGAFDASRSDIGSLPEGVVVAPLREALQNHAALVQPHLTRLTAEDDEAFTQLNGAFLGEGVFVHVPAKTQLEGAVHALFFTTNDAPEMTHPHVLCVVEEMGEATVIEDHVSLGRGACLTNSVSEFVVGKNGHVRRYFIDRSNEESYVVASLYADQRRDSDFASHSALMGGTLARNNVFPTLNGENCMSVMNGVYVPRGTQLHDHRMLVRHAEPNSESRQYYRGILADKAKGFFAGRIIVDEGAQKTDAVQSNKNLLLSGDAMCESKPQLEIYADDVKCTHGATVGQIDDEAIFYCQARGIPTDEARRLLVFAFVNEIFDRMECEPVRERLAAEVEARVREFAN